MASFISTFPAGFEETAAAALLLLLPEAEVETRVDGLLGWRCETPLKCPLPFFTNTFFVLRRFSGGTLAFPKMAAAAKSCRFAALGKLGGTFRVRFSRENQFVSVPGNVSAEAERAVARGTGLTPDRSTPAHEFWFVIRREGTGFFGFLLPKETQRVLEKGELRPELADLALRFAGVSPGGVFCDPFAGHGALPRAALRAFAPKTVFLSDTDGKLIETLRIDPAFSAPCVDVRQADARRLRHIPDQAVDALVTDPPWGLFDTETDVDALYRAFLSEAARIVKPGGTLCVLMARTSEFPAYLAETGAFAEPREADVLVNGKKARVFAAKRR